MADLKILTAPQVMEWLQIDEATLTSMRYRKQIAWFRAGKEIRFTEKAVLDYIAEQERPARSNQRNPEIASSNIVALPASISHEQNAAGLSAAQRGILAARRLKAAGNLRDS